MWSLQEIGTFLVYNRPSGVLERYVFVLSEPRHAAGFVFC
jgi:hypothetical protein